MDSGGKPEFVFNLSVVRSWKQMQEAEQNGQIMLFEMNTNFRGGLLDFDYKKIVFETLCEKFIKFDEYIYCIVLKYGVLCEIGKIKNTIKEMEADGQVEIVRTPALTDTGRSAKWIDWKFDNKKKKCMKVRLVK